MRLIDADALQKVFNEVSSGLLAKPELSKDAEHIVRACLMVTQMINDAPTIEVEPVKHGTWGENIYGYRKCSVCGRVTQVDECMREPLYLYCPYCGAKMDEVENG